MLHMTTVTQSYKVLAFGASFNHQMVGQDNAPTLHSDKKDKLNADFIETVNSVLRSSPLAKFSLSFRTREGEGLEIFSRSDQSVEISHFGTTMAFSEILGSAELTVSPDPSGFEFIVTVKGIPQ